MKNIVCTILIITAVGCQSGPKQHILRVGDSCLIESHHFRIMLVRYDDTGVAIEYTYEDRKLFEAGIDSNTVISSHWIPSMDDDIPFGNLMRVISDGERFVDFTASFTDRDGTIELYDADGNGLPEKRVTVTPSYRLVESITYSFTTNRFHEKHKEDTLGARPVPANVLPSEF